MSSRIVLMADTAEIEQVDTVQPAVRRADALLRRMAWLCAACTAAIGVAVLLGWALGSDVLMAVLPGYIRMKFNAALCFVASGLGAAMLPGNKRSTRFGVQLCTGFVFVCAGATLLEYASGHNLHIDEWLIHDPVHAVFPGRMAQVTAINFCLTALALWLTPGNRRSRKVAQWTALLIAIVSFVSILGFFYGVPILYGSTGYMSMALHTGAAFLFLSVALLLAPKDAVFAHMLTAPERGGQVSRRFLAAVLLLPPLLGWVYLRPAFSFGNTTFSMALFAVTLVVGCTGTLFVLADFLNREERQRAELSLVRERSAAMVRQSEKELRLITDQLPTLLSYIDPQGRFVRVNRTYEVWMGQPSHEIVGKTIRELLGEPYWESTAAARQAVSQGVIVTFDSIYPTRQGDRRVQVTYAPDCDDEGRFQGMACLVLDIHDRHRAEAALRQSEKLAAVGRLASSIAHEINNPLEAVTNLLYLAEQDTGSAYIAQAQQELARVTHIVTQTLRFHRQSTVPLLCKVSDLIDQVTALYQGRLAHSGIAVHRRFREVRPLRCRDGEIRQVVANIVGNASDAMKTGGHLLMRTVHATHPRSGAAGVRVTIADTGHGMTESTRRTLFEPFHTTKGATGSGLGLWISNDIVIRHGGTIRMRSSTRPGRSGTVFQVFFACLAETNEGRAAQPPRPHVSVNAAPVLDCVDGELRDVEVRSSAEL